MPLINISGYNDEYCEYVQRKHKELLEYSRDNNAGNEVAFIVDKDMVEREPIIRDDEKISFGELYGRDLFIMHNHPRNNSYSIDDIVEFFGGSNVKSLSIVKNNGKVEVLTKLMEYDRMTTIKELDRHSLDGSNEEAVKKMRQLLKDLELEEEEKKNND